MMGDPLYEYRPWSDERKARARQASRERLGIKDGCELIYGQQVPQRWAAMVRRAALSFRKHESLAQTQLLCRVLVGFLTTFSE